MTELLDVLLFTTLRAGTPLLLIVLGILITERAGVLNLGQEGLVIMGAVCAFVATDATGSVWLGTLMGVAAGVFTSLAFAILVLGLRANQVAAGLALTIIGAGLAAMIGDGMSGVSIAGMEALQIPVLGALPLIGHALFSHDPLVYVSLLLLLVTWRVMDHSRLGLALTAIGHNPKASHQLGLAVLPLRLMAILTGGAFAGFAGAYLAVAYTPLWSEGMSAGRGWIALALVVFASWRVFRAMFGAYLFGLMSILNLLLQGVGINISPNLLGMLPYVVTILALLLFSNSRFRNANTAPRALGQPYSHGE